MRDLRAEGIEQGGLLAEQRERAEELGVREGRGGGVARLERLEDVARGEEATRRADVIALLQGSPDLLGGVNEELDAAAGGVERVGVRVPRVGRGGGGDGGGGGGGGVDGDARGGAGGERLRLGDDPGKATEGVAGIGEEGDDALRVRFHLRERVRGGDGVAVGGAHELAELLLLVPSLALRARHHLANLIHGAGLEQRVRVALVLPRGRRPGGGRDRSVRPSDDRRVGHRVDGARACLDQVGRARGPRPGTSSHARHFPFEARVRDAQKIADWSAVGTEVPFLKEQVGSL